MDGFVYGTMLGFVLSFVIMFLGATDFRSNWRDQAIERGYGLYCPADGNFAWVNECKDKQNES